MNDFKDQLGFIFAIIGGLLVSMLTSTRHSFWLALTRIAAGLFCAWFFTEPVMHWMELNPATYRNSVAGLLAMAGYAAVRFISDLNKEDLFRILQILRGGK